MRCVRRRHAADASWRNTPERQLVGLMREDRGILAFRRDNTMVDDPVCGVELMPHEAAAESMYDGQSYFFCSQECKDMFDAEPERYVDSPSDQIYRRAVEYS